MYCVQLRSFCCGGRRGGFALPLHALLPPPSAFIQAACFARITKQPPRAACRRLPRGAHCKHHYKCRNVCTSMQLFAEIFVLRCSYKYLCFDAFILRNIRLSMQLLLQRLCASKTIMLSFTTAVSSTLSANNNTRFVCIEKRRNHRLGICSALFCSFSAHHKC